MSRGSDRRQRGRAEVLRRAGLEYVARGRVQRVERATVALAPVPTGPPAAAEPETVARCEPVASARQNVAAAPATRIAAAAETAAPIATPQAEDRARHAALDVLSTDVAACERCPELVACRSRTVFSDGNPDAELCFVGEAPGYDEDQQGTPFVGKAGQLLTRIIEACRLDRPRDVYICNAIKCRPPENRTPLPKEVDNCRPFLEQQLQLIRPKMLVALGKTAVSALFRLPPEKVPITRMRGQFRDYNGIPVMLTFHPSYLLRYPPAKKDVWADMRQVMRELGRPVE